jgi:hypothetical protein
MTRSSGACVLALAAPQVSVSRMPAAPADVSGPYAIAHRLCRRVMMSAAAVVALTPAFSPPLLAATAHAQPSQIPVPLDIGDGPPRYGWKTMSVPVTLQFDAAVPTQLDVIRLARTVQDRKWHLADTARVILTNGAASIDGPIGDETLVLIRALDRPEYLLDGPFRWPSKPSTYYVRADWRKTIRGRFSGVRGALEWITADEQGRGAACEWRGKEDWECVGVPLHARGVVVMLTSGQVACGIPTGLLSSSGIDTARSRTSAWGRLMVVHGPSGGPSDPVRIRANGSGFQSVRERGSSGQAALDTDLHIDLIADGMVWIAGAEITPGVGVEIEASDGLLERIDMRELTAGPADLPLRVQLRPARAPPGRP